MPSIREIEETFGSRDPIKVEGPEDTDLLGVNRACEWTRDLAAHFTVEHLPDGHHATLRIPRAVLRIHSERIEHRYQDSAGNDQVDITYSHDLLPGSYFDGERRPGHVTISQSGLWIHVAWGPALPAYGALPYIHRNHVPSDLDASVSGRTPTGCDVVVVNRNAGDLDFGPLVLLLFW